MIQKIILAISILAATLLPVAVFIVSPTNQTLKNIQSSYPDSKVQTPKTQTYASISTSENIRAYNENFNIYTDPHNHYSLLYAKHLQPLAQENGEINFVEKGSDGPWLINVLIQDSTFSTSKDWLNFQNKQRKNLPPIILTKTQELEKITISFLEIPQEIDLNAKGQPIYENQNAALILKDDKLFFFTKRTQWIDSKNPYDFEDIVKSINFNY